MVWRVLILAQPVNVQNCLIFFRLNASQPSAQEFTKLRRKTPTSVEPVWRRSDGSEGGASLESKDSGRSTDSCSSGRSSPKQDR